MPALWWYRVALVVISDSIDANDSHLSAPQHPRSTRLNQTSPRDALEASSGLLKHELAMAVVLFYFEPRLESHPNSVKDRCWMNDRAGSCKPPRRQFVGIYTKVREGVVNSLAGERQAKEGNKAGWQLQR